ncbi:MAG TPA: hypothetical protein VM911_21610 [Pyrinomonadaceae bacterium]|jgi:hypothetical protein|nr:hypothetical protein [Pyrinomonadaceae bacterium]
MQFIRAVFILALMMVCAVAAAAQTQRPCPLKAAQVTESQELYGFRLGMTIEQVKARMPKLVPGPTDAFGLMKTSFSPDFDPTMNKTAFPGVRTISLEFLDGRLTSLWIGYNKAFKWQALDEFVAGMSRALGMPAAAWAQRSRGGQQLDCNDFQATAQMIAGSPSLHISDEAARSTWETRRTEAEEAEEATEP